MPFLPPLLPTTHPPLLPPPTHHPMHCRYQHEGVKEVEWRSGAKMRPYIFEAIKLVDALPQSSFPGGVRPAGLEFVHFPIVDMGIAPDASVLELAMDLVGRLAAGQNIYLCVLNINAF